MHTTATLHQSKIVLYCKFTTAQQANVTVCSIIPRATNVSAMGTHCLPLGVAG